MFFLGGLGIAFIRQFIGRQHPGFLVIPEFIVTKEQEVETPLSKILFGDGIPLLNTGGALILQCDIKLRYKNLQYP